MNKPILCLDFDGVLHSYKSGWMGGDIIPDDPVPGAIEWLRSLLGVPDNEGIGDRYKDFRVSIYSSRSNQRGGIRAMRKWLKKHGLTIFEIELIDFPTIKPPAFITIDDRVICFDGTFPDPSELLVFQPWYMKGG